MGVVYVDVHIYVYTYVCQLIHRYVQYVCAEGRGLFMCLHVLTMSYICTILLHEHCTCGCSLSLFLCVACAHVCVCVRVRACGRACVRVCVCVCELFPYLQI